MVEIIFAVIQIIHIHLKYINLWDVKYYILVKSYMYCDKMYELPILKCTRCTHEWFPRHKIPPVHCPKCHSPYWNRERRRINESDRTNLVKTQ